MGQPSVAEIEKILNLALDHGVDMIDTAIAYGDSERILGKVGINPFKVVTKLPPCNVRPIEVKNWAYRLVQESLARLKVDSLDGILLHRSQDLLSGLGIELVDVLTKLRIDGLVKKIGISVYDPSELEAMIGEFALDIVQAPSNLVDRRFERSGWLSRLKTWNIQVHTRSTFLQGLLLMSRHAIPHKFHRWSWLWDQWHDNLKKLRVSQLAHAFLIPCPCHILIE